MQLRLCIVIVNYRTPDLVLDSLRTLEGQVDPTCDRVVVVDNDSGDGSVERLQAGVAQAGYGPWVEVIDSGRNGGFSAGNNVGVRAHQARYYLLLNSDTLVQPGAIAALLEAAEANPRVGLMGPRLEWPDGRPQISAFRDHTPLGEFIHAAATSLVTQALSRHFVAMDVSDTSHDAEWVSFACVLVRGEVFERIGLLDEGYFMYFEDSDFCTRARAAGFKVRYFPGARVVHLRGGSSEVKEKFARRQRPPSYFYRSRARYFRKHYGARGLVMANVWWLAGRTVSLGREVVGHKQPHTRQREALDNWLGAWPEIGTAIRRRRRS